MVVIVVAFFVSFVVLFLGLMFMALLLEAWPLVALLVLVFWAMSRTKVPR